MAVAFFALANFLAFIYGIFVSIHEIDIFVCVAFCLATVLSVHVLCNLFSVFFHCVFFLFFSRAHSSITVIYTVR